MDPLENLPVVDGVQYTPTEAAVMQKFFGSPPPPEKKGGIPWKFIGVVTGVCAALYNPISDGMICNIPYVGGKATFFTQIALFAIALVLVCWYML